MNLRKLSWLFAAGAIPAAFLAVPSPADDLDRRVLETEAKRVAVIDKVKPAVVAIIAPGGQNGGSGVVIDKHGYALTNFHVVEATGPSMKCGLPDGLLYDGVLVGLDKVGDVALIKLLPKEKGKDFPAAALGDSDKLAAGQWSLALGNPFLLATDFQPTVTFGLISGVHRYQYPEGTLLEYTDCIQFDTSINPGNSGGPLFNMEGELIGINGRGSFDKRGRVNSGVGYAISINQIKNFLGHLRAGIDTDHATLGAVVETESEGLTVKNVLDGSDVRRRGLDSGDELVAFAGQPMTSVNQFKNVLGLFPKGWRLPLAYRHENQKREVLVRLMQLQQFQRGADEGGKPKTQRRPQAKLNPEAAKFYQPKPGFANYYFNKLERERLLAGFNKHGDFSTRGGEWTIEADAELNFKKTSVRFAIGEEADKTDAAGQPTTRPWTHHLDANTLEALPPLEEGETAPLRQAVRKAGKLLREHAKSFPQEIRAGETEAKTKENAAEARKKAEGVRKTLFEALEELKKTGAARDKESRLWQANYDYQLARLSAFCAYVLDYAHLLDQLAGDKPPARDPKKHRGWRMTPEDNPQSGAEAVKLAGEANALWQKMLKDYQGTVWGQAAQKELQTKLGLKWQAAGGNRTLVRYWHGGVPDEPLDPLKFGQDVQALKNPPGSGGLMTALYQYRHFLTHGPAGFEGYCHHGGREPFYPPAAGAAKPKSLNELRVDAEVLATEHAAVGVKWYFSLQDQKLLGFEAAIDREDDPCEVYLSDYRAVEGLQLPHRLEVRHGNDTFGVFTIRPGGYKLEAAR